MIDVERGDRPACLDNGYTDPEFRAVLHARFHGKCYLTERPILAASMDVEHRVPRHAGGGEHDWENLFPADPKANAHRRRTLPDGGYLSPGQGVDTRIVHGLRTDHVGVECTFTARDPTDAPARNTAAELHRLHAEIRDPPLDWSRDLRDAIHTALTRLLEEVATWLSLPTEDPERAVAEARVRRRLSRSAPYTGLLRAHPTAQALRHLWD